MIFWTPSHSELEDSAVFTGVDKLGYLRVAHVNHRMSVIATATPTAMTNM
jgi:hypothetical protein